MRVYKHGASLAGRNHAHKLSRFCLYILSLLLSQVVIPIPVDLHNSTIMQQSEETSVNYDQVKLMRQVITSAAKVKSLTAELKASEEMADAMSVQIEALEGSIVRLHAVASITIDAYKSANGALQEHIHGLSNHAADLKNENAAIVAERDALKESNKQQGIISEKDTDLISVLNTENENFTIEIKELKESNKKQRILAEAGKKASDAASVRIGSLEKSITDLDAVVDSRVGWCNHRDYMMQEQLTNLSNVVSELQNKNAALTAERDGVSDLNRNQRLAIAGHAEEMRSATARIAALEGSIFSLGLSSEGQQRDCLQTEESLDRANVKVADLERRLTESNSRLEMVRVEREAAVKQVNLVNAQIASKTVDIEETNRMRVRAIKERDAAIEALHLEQAHLSAARALNDQRDLTITNLQDELSSADVAKGAEVDQRDKVIKRKDAAIERLNGAAHLLEVRLYSMESAQAETLVSVNDLVETYPFVEQAQHLAEAICNAIGSFRTPYMTPIKDKSSSSAGGGSAGYKRPRGGDGGPGGD
jgi:chromosome segregation ATPase